MLKAVIFWSPPSSQWNVGSIYVLWLKWPEKRLISTSSWKEFNFGNLLTDQSHLLITDQSEWRRGGTTLMISITYLLLCTSFIITSFIFIITSYVVFNHSIFNLLWLSLLKQPCPDSWWYLWKQFFLLVSKQTVFLVTEIRGLEKHCSRWRSLKMCLYLCWNADTKLYGNANIIILTCIW